MTKTKARAVDRDVLVRELRAFGLSLREARKLARMRPRASQGAR